MSDVIAPALGAPAVPPAPNSTNGAQTTIIGVVVASLVVLVIVLLVFAVPKYRRREPRALHGCAASHAESNGPLSELPSWATVTEAGQEPAGGRVLYVALWCGHSIRALSRIRDQAQPPAGGAIHVVSCGDPGQSNRCHNPVPHFPVAYANGSEINLSALLQS